MGFVEAVQSVLSKYAVFSGRASRSEFWWFQLAFFLAAIVLDLADHILTGKSIHAEVFLDLVLFLPALGLAVRRLHDIDRSGWWYLIALVPVLGWLMLLIWDCTPGTEGGNNYGDDPLRRANLYA